MFWVIITRFRIYSSWRIQISQSNYES